jgi:peptide/nickel transport system substrate-binding protein
VEQTLERWTSRLPAWARGWSRRRIAASAAIVVLVVVLAVSCGGGSGGRADVPVLAGGADTGVTGVRAPSGAHGGTLRVVTGDVDNLDPQRSYQPGLWNLMRLYTRTLVTYSSRPGHTGDLVPDLATDLGKVSKDGRSWTFTLKKGLRFENGAPITSRDVKYGIERSFASDVVVGGPTYVVDLLDVPGNPYPGPYQDTTKDKLGLGSIQTPDDSTIVFTLRTPRPELPYVMALPSSSPVPRAADTGAAYGKHPISSGPYVIRSIDPAMGITLDRNPKWDPSTDKVRTALPDHVVVRTGLSGLERDQALLAGSADADIFGTGIQTQTTARLGDDSDPLRDRIDRMSTGAVRMIALPTNVAPMTNPHCRAAVAAALDRHALQGALGGSDAAVRSSQLWPRGLPGGPNDSDPAQNLGAARSALMACGKPNGFATTLAVVDAKATVDLANGVRKELGAVGIKVTVKPLDVGTFYANDIGNPANVVAKGYGIVLTTWTADFPTPGSFLTPLLDGRTIRTGANTDYAMINDPAINALIDKARAADADAGPSAWRAVASAGSKTSAYLPLAETRIQLIAGERLHNGVVMQPYSGYDLATAGVR